METLQSVKCSDVSGSGGAKHAVCILRTNNAVKSHDTTQTSAVGDTSGEHHVRFWVKSCVWRTRKPFAAAESFVTLNTGSHRATLDSLRGWCLDYLTTVMCLLSLLMSWGSLHRNKKRWAWCLQMKSLWELKSRGVGSKHLSVVPRKGRWTLPMLSLATRGRGTGGSWAIRTKRCSLQELGLGLPPVSVWPDDFLIFRWVFAPKTRFCPNYLFPWLLPFLVWVLVYFQSLCHSVCSFFSVCLSPSFSAYWYCSRNDTE